MISKRAACAAQANGKPNCQRKIAPKALSVQETSVVRYRRGADFVPKRLNNRRQQSECRRAFEFRTSSTFEVISDGLRRVSSAR